MLAIIFALKEWCQYLLDTHEPFTILTDHKNLKYFTKPQDLSRQQARWNQIRQEYHYCMSSNIGPVKPTPQTLCPGGQTLKRG